MLYVFSFLQDDSESRSRLQKYQVLRANPRNNHLQPESGSAQERALQTMHPTGTSFYYAIFQNSTTHQVTMKFTN